VRRSPPDGGGLTPFPVSRRAWLGGLAGLAFAPGYAAAEAPLATPLALAPLPADSDFRLLGGLEIDRRALGFGGLSGLHLAPDLTLSVVSDLGRFAEFTLQVDAALRPTGLALRRSGRLLDGAGRALPRGYSSDAEALARLPDGTWLVAFERWHRIRRYRDLGGPGTYAPAPPGLEAAPPNGGLESIAVLADGRWLAMAEHLAGDAPGTTQAWIGGPAGWRGFAWRPAVEHAPVDAAPLPDGGALVLERAFSILGGFRGRLVRVPAAALAAPGPVLEGEEVLRLDAPLPVDNWEALSVVEREGRWLVALASDDNESAFQRSLFLLLELRR
jgi:hypothetical protein